MKLIEKKKEPIEAFQWPEPSSVIGVKKWVDEIEEFEEWVKTFIPKEMKHFKYRGPDLVYDYHGFFEETVIEPLSWVVLLENEFGVVEPNFMTNEYVKESYDIEDPK